ncbi:MAG: class A beta-lactamase [Pseudomonadota bacterium]
MIDKRRFVMGSLALGACSVQPAVTKIVDNSALQSIEASLGGGRLGVAALDTASERWLLHRPDEKFAMCSTFKLLLVANVLWSAAHGGAQLEDRVRYSDGDLLEYAPVTRAHVAEGAMTVEQLCEAAITLSDNTAANLLMPAVMGPEGLTRFLRSQRDPVTRLDRTEPTLNENAANDIRDTTEPQAMARTMRALLLGDALTAPLKEKLIGWMIACQTGDGRLRAGVPPDWRIGDKTGTGENGAHNDIAIAYPPGHAPIIIASLTSEGSADGDVRKAAHAAVARAVVAAFS